MIYKIELLLDFVDEKIHPQNLIHRHLSKDEISGWTPIITSELRHIRRAFLLDADSSINEQVQLINQLIEISNTVHHYLHDLFPVWKVLDNVTSIRCFYLETLNSLESLLSSLKALKPQIGAECAITFYGLTGEIQQLKSQLNLLKDHLDLSMIDPELKRILITGLQKFLRKRRLTLPEASYIRKLTAEIIQNTQLDTIQLRDLLYGYDFNLPEFFMYWIDEWRKLLLEKSGLHDQLEIIMRQLDSLYNLKRYQGLHLLKNEQPLAVDLKCYLNEKSEIIKQLIKLRRLVIKDRELINNYPARLRINLPVAQFALLIRLQIEKGTLQKEHIGELFSFFAAHFYTPQTVFISAESLQKKSTDIEYATAKKMKGLLIEMLNWLNEHFKLQDSK